MGERRSRPLRVLRLIVAAAPGLCTALTVVTVLRGLVPVVEILVAAELVELLVAAATGERPGTSVLWPLVVLLVVEAVAAVLDQAAVGLRELFETRAANHIAVLVAAQAARLDLAAFETPELHDEMRRAREASARSALVVQQLSAGISLAVTSTSLAWVLLGWHWWVMPLTVTVAAASLAVQGRVQRTSYQLDQQQTPRQRRAEYLASLLTDRAAAKEIRLFGLGDLLLGKLRGIVVDLQREQRTLVVRRSARAAVLECGLALAQPALIGLAVVEALRGDITIAQWTLFTQAVRQLHDSSGNLAQVAVLVYRGGLHAGDVLSLLAREPLVEAPRPGCARVGERPVLELRGVGFTYPGAASPAVSAVDLVIAPGRTTAVVGHNGAGKSTLVKLMTGLYRPTEGQVLLDGVDLAELDPAAVRRRLSGVFQDFAVFDLTIRENIAVGDVDAGDDAVVAAALRSGLHEKVVARLPSGYDTLLGRSFAGGHELSGGQRQLLAVTRGLLRDSPILLLDEPSSALDAESERHFFQTVLAARCGSRSTVFISHRMTTVRQADEVVLLDGGRIAERGTHDDLMRCAGRYRALFDLHSAPYRQVRAEGVGLS
ncbi:ABC transporter ATP-binding protein [Actinokineospora guangxiensis]|uniref:ABC transporter ATP-binding protein n=1 Tax=Actinokineospora guangxiensis TaxID=1490288 RepID=A0ABW0ERV5_9PSEU